MFGLARIAQLVERIHGKDEVISSILIVGSMLFICFELRQDFLSFLFLL